MNMVLSPVCVLLGQSLSPDKWLSNRQSSVIQKAIYAYPSKFMSTQVNGYGEYLF